MPSRKWMENLKEISAIRDKLKLKKLTDATDVIDVLADVAKRLTCLLSESMDRELVLEARLKQTEKGLNRLNDFNEKHRKRLKKSSPNLNPKKKVDW